MKHIIANRDINDPAEFREVATVEMDVKFLAQPDEPQLPDFSKAIEQVIAHEQVKLEAQKEREALREARVLASARFKAVAEEIKKTTGLAIGFKDPWAYKPKATAAYGLWKKVVPLLVQDEKMLSTRPSALACRLDANEPNYSVTRDMLYDPLNRYAVQELKRLLRRLGVTLKLEGPVTIRSIQKELQERRKSSEPAQEEAFSGRFEIRGDTAYVNGKGYKIQLNRSGKRRIKLGGKDWLPLDTLKAFCGAE